MQQRLLGASLGVLAVVVVCIPAALALLGALVIAPWLAERTWPAGRRVPLAATAVALANHRVRRRDRQRAAAAGHSWLLRRSGRLHPPEAALVPAQQPAVGRRGRAGPGRRGRLANGQDPG
jgi:hypothetical protein